MKIKNLLKNGIDKLNNNNIEESNLKAKILLCHILNVNKEYLTINDNKELTEEQIIKFDKYIDLLMQGKPIQYITNKQEFMGLEFYVDENVLIPQPDTEILVETALQCIKNIIFHDSGRRGRRPLQNEYNKNNIIKILDLCTRFRCNRNINCKKYKKQYNCNRYIRQCLTNCKTKCNKK